jgi:hypothetical protein
VSRVFWEDVDEAEETDEVREGNASSCMLSKDTIDFELVRLVLRDFVERRSLRLSGCRSMELLLVGLVARTLLCL